VSQATKAPAASPPRNRPHPAGQAAGPAAVPAPQPSTQVNGNGASAGGGGARSPLSRLDGFSTASEYLKLAGLIMKEHVERHDLYLQLAAILERGIKGSSSWPWALDKLVVARRASRPLRQNAGAELDAARRMSTSVRVLVQLRDAPRARTASGFDVTR
jgi:hypothetical protein